MSLTVFLNGFRSRVIGSCMAAGLAALVVSPAPLSAQTAGTPTMDNPLGIPQNITIYGDENPNQRSATAVVNGYVITGTDIEQRVALVTSAAQSEVSDDEMKRLRFQVLRNLIDETLKIQAAEALELKVQRGEIEQTYNQLAAQNFGSEPAKMDEYLQSVGSSANALKRQIEGELAWENLLRRNVTPFINVSQEEVEEYLKRLEESRGTDEYHLGEIYMNATSENRDTVLQNMNQIMEQLQSGGSFVAYARQFSEASTAAVGGDLGWVRLGLLPSALSNAAQRMQPGQLNGPIEIPGGYSIIYLRNKRQVMMSSPEDAILSLKQISIALEPGISQADAEAKINQFGAFIQGLRGCADAETARNEIGASVVSNDQIRAGNLPEQLRAIILGLQIGQTTPAFGSPEEGVRVLMLCSREDSQNDSGPTFQTVMNQIEEERINKRAQRYLRDLRNDAYIEYN